MRNTSTLMHKQIQFGDGIVYIVCSITNANIRCLLLNKNQNSSNISIHFCTLKIFKIKQFKKYFLAYLVSETIIGLSKKQVRTSFLLKRLFRVSTTHAAYLHSSTSCWLVEWFLLRLVMPLTDERALSPLVTSPCDTSYQYLICKYPLSLSAALITTLLS